MPIINYEGLVTQTFNYIEPTKNLYILNGYDVYAYISITKKYSRIDLLSKFLFYDTLTGQIYNVYPIRKQICNYISAKTLSSQGSLSKFTYNFVSKIWKPNPGLNLVTLKPIGRGEFTGYRYTVQQSTSSDLSTLFYNNITPLSTTSENFKTSFTVFNKPHNLKTYINITNLQNLPEVIQIAIDMTIYTQDPHKIHVEIYTGTDGNNGDSIGIFNSNKPTKVQGRTYTTLMISETGIYTRAQSDYTFLISPLFGTNITIYGNTDYQSIVDIFF